MDVLLSAILVGREKGVPCHIIAVITDITDRKQIERALKKSDGFLDKTGTLAGVGGWEFDIASSKLTWSDQTCRIHGMPPGHQPTIDEAIGYHMPSGRETVGAAVELCIATGAPWDVELPITRADGVVIDTRSMGTPEYQNGALTRLYGAIQDVTELRKLQLKLQQSQKVEAVGRLAAGVAHDFNNILQSVTGSLEMLRAEPGRTREASEMIDIAQKAAARGGYLTHHLLAYTRQQMLRPRILAIGQILGDLAQLLRRTFGPHIGIVHNDDSNGTCVLVDQSMLEMVVINLAIHAGHATPKGGTLVFHYSRQQIDRAGWLPGGTYAVVHIEDCGVGIPPDILPRVFDPFFTTKGLEGTSLGLPMLQGFARQSGGDVRLTSVVGSGTTVKLWLPVATADCDAVAVVEPEQLDQRIKVLLVDDDADVLRSLEIYFERAGLAVACADSAAAALVILAEQSGFDVLVTDYAMHGMNGLELIDFVEAAGSVTGCVLITGYANIEPIETRRLTVLRKPFRMADLACAIGKFEHIKRKGARLSSAFRGDD